MMQLGPETVIQLATHLIMKKRTLSIKHFKTTTGSLKIQYNKKKTIRMYVFMYTE